MSNILQFTPKRDKTKEDLVNTAVALQTMYESLDSMYEMLTATEEKVTEVEAHFNEMYEEYDGDKEDLEEYYTADLPKIGVTNISIEDFKKLEESPDFPEILFNPEAIKEYLSEN